MEDPAKKYFTPKATDRDRAVFEAGLALGMVVHQFTGIPIKSNSDVEIIEKAIEKAILSQPYRVNAVARISKRFNHSPSNPYDYSTLKTSDLDVTVEVKYGRVRVRARLRYIKELNFNLGYIEDIEEE
ncbi:dihydroneopterin aldolase family protein [Thermogladius sp. 4427co]|uniref:dihydroneopterin aldolase family protein n=1 Tax=Thermogladius sp. 4427co TaxID=3450718 RepID=UPI003F79AF5C